jgi:F-type H+-transporting ATPase subunit b
MLKSPDTPVIIRCAFKLAPLQIAAIEDALKTIIATKPPVQFEIVPDLIGGIELVINGQKVAWSIANYLASLEKDVDELLNGQRKAEASANHATPQ